MSKREEKRNLETIPVGTLGIIPLEGCKVLPLQAIKEILIFCRQKSPVSAPAKQRESFLSLYVELIYTFWWTLPIIV